MTTERRTIGIKILARAVWTLVVCASPSAMAQDEASSPAGETPASPESAAPQDEPAVELTPPAPAAPVGPPVDKANPVESSRVVAGYDKGFFVRSADDLYELKIGARMQARFTLQSLESWVDDENAAVPDTEREREMAFAIQRAEFKLAGHVFSPRLEYEIQFDFGKGAGGLKEYFANIHLVNKALYLQVGQWKRPFSRQQLTSAGSMELVDRAITDKAFGCGRDIGLAFHNDYMKSPTFEWAVGVFNGTGEGSWFEGKLETDDATGEQSISEKSKFINVPDKFHPMAVARFGFNTKNLKGYSEADLEGGPARFGIAASGLADFDADDDKNSNLRGEADFILKAYGFSTTGGAYIGTASAADFGDQKYSLWGAHLQAGYTVKKMVEPVLRYAVVDPKGDAMDQEILGGLAIYFFGHNVKWQTDGGALLHNSEDPTGQIGLLADALVRTQLQFAF